MSRDSVTCVAGMPMARRARARSSCVCRFASTNQFQDLALAIALVHRLLPALPLPVVAARRCSMRRDLRERLCRSSHAASRVSASSSARATAFGPVPPGSRAFDAPSGRRYRAIAGVNAGSKAASASRVPIRRLLRLRATLSSTSRPDNLVRLMKRRPAARQRIGQIRRDGPAFHGVQRRAADATRVVSTTMRAISSDPRN